jgi:hypothetical protein
MRRLLGTLSLCLGTACAPAASSPPSSAAPPPVAPPAAELARSGIAVVAEAEVRLADAARGREIVVAVTYPGGDGPFPVITFSHGEAGSPKDSRPLLRFWATRGYVVLAPAHADAASGKTAGDPKAWENRARDLAFVLDSLPLVGEHVPRLAGKMDAARIGAAGQAYGAYTAGLLAGATVDLPKGGKGKSFADARPKAFLLLSPPGQGWRGFSRGSWTDVTRPLMVVTGSRDKGPKGQDSSWRLDPFTLSPPGEKFMLLLRGAGAPSFTGKYAEPGASLSGRGKGAPSADEEVALFKDLKAVTVAFWDATMRGDAAARAFLASDGLAKESGGRATLDRR